MASSSHDRSADLGLSPLTWIGSDRRLARRVGRPMLRFLRIEAAGGIVMLLAAVIALVWDNSPWSGGYHWLLEHDIAIQIGGMISIEEPFEAWINDALMVVFFFVMGLEIKRELVVGELRRPKAALLPAIGALGGMVVPALIYLAFNAGGDGAAGWGIPMATDIAFAVGVVSLLGSRVPNSLRIFLLTLAIIDDIGAIIVIALFYTDDLSSGWLLIALATVLLIVMMRLVRIWYAPAYVVVGVFLWLAVFESGVHATIAGVILGILTPAKPLVIDSRIDPPLLDRITAGALSVSAARRVGFEVREHVAVADRLAGLLHPWTSFVIVPIFALANAGVTIASDPEHSADSLLDTLHSPVTLGIVGGLVVGKLVGVSLFCWLAVRSGLCSLPRGATWSKVVGIGAVSGIGFTVSLFITGLAFTSEPFTSQAKTGILVASALAATIGAVILRGSKPAPVAA